MQAQNGKSPVRGARLRSPLAPSALALACSLVLAGAAQAQSTSLDSLRVQARGGATLAPATGTMPATGPVRVIVQFNEPSVVDARTAQRRPVAMSQRAQMLQEAGSLRSAKAPRVAQIQRLGGKVQNTLEFAFNGAVVEIDASRIDAVRRIPGVKSVEPAGVFEMNQTPPTIPELLGTLPVNQAGNGGQNVAIAVIDSGVDYTHASFQGPGTRAYYLDAIGGAGPTTIGDTPGVFPNGPRVKGGYDWLGETWPNGAVTPDPDPIDNRQPGESGPGAGHGTNAASAAAGSAVPAGGLQPGSAPEAFVLGYRGCARAASSCEGSALLNSIDSIVKYALGMPNEGQPGADNPMLPEGTRFVINMSLGAAYGNPLTNALAEASRAAVRAGVTVVASAGNSNNIPFITGTPSSADTVISVAASEPATLIGGRVDVGAPLNKSYTALLAGYGPLPGDPITAPLAFAGPNNTIGNFTNLACSSAPNNLPNPGPASPAIPDLNGALGMTDRGVCEFSEKTVNVQRAGGSAMVMFNNQAGTIAPGAGQAAALVTIPTVSLTQADGNEIKTAVVNNPGMTATVSVANLPNVVGGVNIVDQLSGFTARGPSQAGMALKPDITAPGTSIWMASVGTGFGGVNNSGTSFSGPLTAGVAALVKSARPDFAPWQVKAAMMNTADTDVFASKSAGTLAGLTRMGAGRVRADRAVATTTLAYDAQDVDPTATQYFNTSASFGYQAFSSAGSSVARTIVVQNLSDEVKTYNISVNARFADDTTRGVSFAPSVPVLAVAPNSTGTFQIIATATNPAAMPARLVNEDTCTTTTNPPGPNLTCTSRFDLVEQDGFVTISAGPNDTVRVPYLMYPRGASNVQTVRIGASLALNNSGAVNTAVEVFNLVGGIDAQGDTPAYDPNGGPLPVDLRAVGVRYLPNAVTTPPAGATPDVLQFAISTWTLLDAPRNAVFNVEIDTTGDGNANFLVRNLNTTENRGAVFIAPVTNGVPGANGSAFFRTDQPLASKRAVLSVFPAFMGINANSRIGIRVSSSNFAGGPVLDTLGSGQFQYVKLNELAVTPSARSLSVAAGTRGRVGFSTNAANVAASPADKGLLVIAAENTVDTDAQVVQVLP